MNLNNEHSWLNNTSTTEDIFDYIHEKTGKLMSNLLNEAEKISKEDRNWLSPSEIVNKGIDWISNWVEKNLGNKEWMKIFIKTIEDIEKSVLEWLITLIK